MCWELKRYKNNTKQKSRLLINKLNDIKIDFFLGGIIAPEILGAPVRMENETWVVVLRKHSEVVLMSPS